MENFIIEWFRKRVKINQTRVFYTQVFDMPCKNMFCVKLLYTSLTQPSTNQKTFFASGSQGNFTIIYKNLYLKPSGKHLSNHIRNWAKSDGLILTGSDRIDSKIITAHIEQLDGLICHWFALRRKNEIGPNHIPRLLKLRKVFVIALLKLLATDIDVLNCPIPKLSRGQSASIER